MFTINIDDHFVLPDFHCGCTGGISGVMLSTYDHTSVRMRKMLHHKHVGLYAQGTVHPATLFYLDCNKTITVLSFFLRLIERFL